MSGVLNYLETQEFVLPSNCGSSITVVLQINQMLYKIFGFQITN